MEDKRIYTARAFTSTTGRWYVTPDKYGRFSIPKAFSPTDPKKGYRFELTDERTIILKPNEYYPVLIQLCIPSAIRQALNVSGGNDIFQISRCEDGIFKLILCKGDEIV